MDKEILKKIDPELIYALIPARSGSKGVKDKNIRCINGYPLMAYSIAAARLCPRISRIIVSTDSERYANIARYYGADVPFIRPGEYATDTSTDIEFVEHAIEWFSQNESTVPAYFVHLRPTYPDRDPNVVQEAVDTMLNDPAATSLRSAHRADFAPYKWFTMGEDGYFRCLFESMTLDEANMPRQGFPQVYIPDGYVDVLSVRFVVKNDLMHGGRMVGFEVPEGTDVDTPGQLCEVENSMDGGGSTLFQYLREHYKPLRETKL